MNVLFVYSLHYYRLKKKQVVANAIQLGISYISSFLNKHGHNTELLVLSRYFSKRNRRLIDNYLKSFSPGLICFTAVASEYPFIVGIAKYIKTRYPDTYLLIGGPHVSLNPENILSDDFDALCIGEGEFPVLELVYQLEKGVAPSGIPNLWIKRENSIQKNPARPFLQDLDSLPFPDRNMWDAWIEPKGARYSVLLGRGCPFQCTYCCNHALRKVAPGNYIRLRSPENIVEEIRDMVSKFPIKNEIYLEVETIAVNKEWTIELCSKLENFNATLRQPISFGANIRVVPNADLESLFAVMKKCNLRFVNIGVESGCERVRDEILKRHYSNRDIVNTVELARKYGFKVCFFNMLGIPGETAADFEETVRINRQCLPDWHFTSIFFPYPGTDLYRMCMQQGLLNGPLNSDMERRQAVLDLPTFPRKHINRSFNWFDYHVYKGHRPLHKILMDIFALKLEFLIGSLLLLRKDKVIKTHSS